MPKIPFGVVVNPHLVGSWPVGIFRFLSFWPILGGISGALTLIAPKYVSYVEDGRFIRIALPVGVILVGNFPPKNTLYFPRRQSYTTTQTINAGS